jgi:hypothetical protein
MMVHRFLAPIAAVALLASASHLRAQDTVPVPGPVVVDPFAVMTLAEEPWRDRRSFVDALDAALGGLKLDMPRLAEAVREDDPFLWSVMGRFGAEVPGLRSSGGIVACSRYGLSTRDRLAETNLSDPSVFAIFGATQAAPDDADVWPETGVARLACIITWNDTRRVAILPEAAARAALVSRFDSVTRNGDREALGEDWQSRPPRFGPDGYQLIGRDGPSDSVVAVESARIELRVAHQQIRFRAFLLNGGM